MLSLGDFAIPEHQPLLGVKCPSDVLTTQVGESVAATVPFSDIEDRVAELATTQPKRFQQSEIKFLNGAIHRTRYDLNAFVTLNLYQANPQMTSYVYLVVRESIRPKIGQIDPICVDVIPEGLATRIRERKRTPLYLYCNRLYLAG